MQSDKDIRLPEGFRGQSLVVLPRTIVTGFLNTDPVTSHLFITDIGYYPKARYHYVERPEGIDQHIIIYCTDGGGWLEVNRKRITLSASEFIIVPAETPHRYAADVSKPWTIYWLHFKGDASSFIVDLILKGSEDYKPQLSFNEDRIKLFDEICHNLEKGYSEDTLRYVNMVFSHFLSSLIYENKFGRIEKPENDFLAKTVGYMQDKINSAIKLDELAAFVNLSASHFSAVFKAKTGHSPIEYFNQLKVQKACQYLSFTNMPVKEIALKLGIADQYYFSRMFTKLMGVSPTGYRDKN